MSARRATLWVASAAIVLAGGQLAWRLWQPEPQAVSAAPNTSSSNTAVLGSAGRSPGAARQQIPPPPAPRGSAVAILPDRGEDDAIAAWEHEGRVFGARYGRDTGWTEAAAFETILGDASDLQLAGNGRGTAMAVWRHRVGSIDSLRFSRFQSETGWSPPDVVPGVLPLATAAAVPPKLEVDGSGQVTLSWPSAFGSTQSAQYRPGRGWSAPRDLASR